MYKEIETIPDFPKYEREQLEFWKNLDPISKLKELRKNSPEFVYFDGPITTNGRPHYGHGITWTMKDIIPRYQSMRGRYVSRNIGWDCQGILVEIEIEKELGFKQEILFCNMNIDLGDLSIIPMNILQWIQNILKVCGGLLKSCIEKVYFTKILK